MGNVSKFKGATSIIASQNKASPSTMLLSVLALSAALNGGEAQAATKNDHTTTTITTTSQTIATRDFGLDTFFLGNGFGHHSRSTFDSLHGAHGIHGWNRDGNTWHSHNRFNAADHFLTRETNTLITPGFWSELKQSREVRAAEAQSHLDTIITPIAKNARGETIYKITDPSHGEMSIDTPFRGTPVREGSPTFVVEGELGQEVVTFFGLDTTKYEGEQVRPHPTQAYAIGEIFNLGEEVAAGKRKVSENARVSIIQDEINMGIGFSMLQKGDQVIGTQAIITNGAGETTQYNVTEFIMTKERMAALEVKTGGQGAIPDDYLVVAITEGADGVLKQIHQDIAKPGAKMHFIADSKMGARISTENTPLEFGEAWAQDVALGESQIKEGVDFALPLTGKFAVIASFAPSPSNQMDHKIANCKIAGVDEGNIAEFIKNFDIYEQSNNHGDFSGPFPRKNDVHFITKAGTHTVVGAFSKHMWSVNGANAEKGAVDWAMTGSAGNALLTMVEPIQRTLTSGCVVDNNGSAPTPLTPRYGFTPGGALTQTFGGNGSGYGGLGGFGLIDFGGGGYSSTTTTTITHYETPAPIPLPAPFWLLLAGVGGLAAYGKRKATGAAAVVATAATLSGELPPNDNAPIQYPTYDAA